MQNNENLQLIKQKQEQFKQNIRQKHVYAQIEIQRQQLLSKRFQIYKNISKNNIQKLTQISLKYNLKLPLFSKIILALQKQINTSEILNEIFQLFIQVKQILQQLLENLQISLNFDKDLQNTKDYLYIYYFFIYHFQYYYGNIYTRNLEESIVKLIYQLELPMLLKQILCLCEAMEKNISQLQQMYYITISKILKFSLRIINNLCYSTSRNQLKHIYETGIIQNCFFFLNSQSIYKEQFNDIIFLCCNVISDIPNEIIDSIVDNNNQFAFRILQNTSQIINNTNILLLIYKAIVFQKHCSNKKISYQFTIHPIFQIFIYTFKQSLDDDNQEITNLILLIFGKAKSLISQDINQLLLYVSDLKDWSVPKLLKQYLKKNLIQKKLQVDQINGEVLKSILQIIKILLKSNYNNNCAKVCYSFFCILYKILKILMKLKFDKIIINVFLKQSSKDSIIEKSLNIIGFLLIQGNYKLLDIMKQHGLLEIIGKYMKYNSYSSKNSYPIIMNILNIIKFISKNILYAFILIIKYELIEFIMFILNYMNVGPVQLICLKILIIIMKQQQQHEMKYEQDFLLNKIEQVKMQQQLEIMEMQSENAILSKKIQQLLQMLPCY